MNKPLFAFQVHVDTEIGTRIGIPNLLKLFQALKIPATFYLSLGPDHTGRAIQRIFRPGFFKKCSRTSVIGTYGLRTVLYGVLLPGPHIGKKHRTLLQQINAQGFEVGIHSYDHQKWQDGVMRMSEAQITSELQKARAEFQRIFNTPAQSAASPGWQANAKTLAAYDQANFIYASDSRGFYPFFPKIDGTTYKTLQIPTTLPTLDELLGRPEFPQEKLTQHYLSLLKSDHPNVMTIHAELEGMKYLDWFRGFLQTLQPQVQLQTMGGIANQYLADRMTIPLCEIMQEEIDGRSGKLAVQALYHKHT